MERFRPLLLVAIFLSGAFFRFHHLTRYEPFIADEAAYHLEARYVYRVVSHVVDIACLKLEERRTGENLVTREDVLRRFRVESDGKPPWYARPLHIYLIALAMRLWSPETVWLGGLVSACFGSLCILLVYLLASRLYGPGTGLVAAALFSLCGYQVVYSHTGLTEQDSLFFLLLAGLFHVLAKDRPDGNRGGLLFLTGLSLGACFATHYRMLAAVLAFLVWEAVLQPCSGAATRRERLRGRFSSMGILVSGVAVPIILMEIPYYLVTLAFHGLLKARPPFATYFEQLLVQASVSFYTNLLSTERAFGLSNLLTYPYLLWKLSGPLMPLALLAALVAALRRRTASDLWTFTLFAIPFLLCTLLQPRARYACSFLAFGSILVAAALRPSREVKDSPLVAGRRPGSPRQEPLGGPRQNRLTRHSQNRVSGTRGRPELPQDEGAGSSLLKVPEDEESSPGRAQNVLAKTCILLGKGLRASPWPAGGRLPTSARLSARRLSAPSGVHAGRPSRPRLEAATLSQGLLTLALLLAGAWFAWRAGRPEDSYIRAMEFLRSQGTLKHLSTYPLVSQVYAGVGQVPAEWPPPSKEELLRLYQEGYRFVLIDVLKDAASFFLGQLALDTNPAFRARVALLNSLEAEVRPVFVTENHHVGLVQNIFEVNHNFLQTLSYYRRMSAAAEARTIRVYDLGDWFGDRQGDATRP